MSDKDCPDKLEPQYLTSVLKNVPKDMMWDLRQYHSKPSHFEIKWRARQPVEGKKYGWGGDLKWEDAQSGDMYVRDRSLEQKYQHLQDVNRNLTNNLVEATRNYDDLLHQLQDEKMCLTHVDNVMVDVKRGKDKKWTDDMSEQADKDYDAVTKGVISLINLLRR
jgi:hypothetical protein